MQDTTDHGTIDWNRFWNDADESERDGATASAHHARGGLADFVAETAVPESVADVGCGPGHVTFDLADRYPDATVVGYDAAAPIVEENRERARREGIGNVRFERTVLPTFDPGRTFDLVFCYATIGYIADPERAVENLYDAVAPGGYLVLSYPNRLARSHYREVADAPEKHLPEGSGFDPDRYADRFRLVIEGESLLSYERIHDVLGAWPRSVWSVVEKPDVQWAWRHHPLVFVPKGGDRLRSPTARRRSPHSRASAGWRS